MADISPEEFGEVKANTNHCKDGIQRIENLIGDHLKNYREDLRDLHGKADKAHERIDDVKQSYAKDKGFLYGAIAVVSAVWTWILNVLTGGE